MKLNIRNFRDISGYKNKDGSFLKKGAVYRGAALDQVNHEEALYMEKTLGIRYILDYRDEEEAALKKDVVTSGMIYERISALKLHDEEQNGFDFGTLLSGTMSLDKLQFLVDYLQAGYRSMAFNNPAYHRLFELLLRNDGAIYFHCSAGKDRTGIAAFLIMVALGMSEKDAIQEYLLSNHYLEDFAKQFCEQYPVLKDYQNYVNQLLLVSQENIQLTIQSIKEKYATYDLFLEKEYGINEEKRNQLKSIYCQAE